MQISDRERNILIMAGVVAMVFIATQLWPAIDGLYEQRQQNIETVRLDIDREIRLIEDTASWRSRRVEVEERTAELERQIFTGETIPLVEANISRDLNTYARESGITVSSNRLAERLESGDWLLISQEMSFRTPNAGNTVALLQKLENSEPRLHVKDFSLNRSRTQYSGSITVVGFARSAGLVSGPGVARR